MGMGLAGITLSVDVRNRNKAVSFTANQYDAIKNMKLEKAFNHWGFGADSPKGNYYLKNVLNRASMSNHMTIG